MAPRKTRPHDYTRDVVNPVYREAEERVYRWLLAQGKHVRDDRAEKTWHDFTLGHAWTLDVKCDTFGYTNGRVAWEQGLDFGSHIRDGWGLHHGLNYVAYVLLPPEEQRQGPWPVLVCHAARLREFALRNRDTPSAVGFSSRGTDRVGFGYTLDIDELRRDGVVLLEGEC